MSLMKNDALMLTRATPYFKLIKLLRFAYNKRIICEWEFNAFEVELDLLAQGKNRPHNVIPRDYIKKELNKSL
jgi:hypothetical protein